MLKNKSQETDNKRSCQESLDWEDISIKVMGVIASVLVGMWVVPFLMLTGMFPDDVVRYSVIPAAIFTVPIICYFFLFREDFNGIKMSDLTLCLLSSLPVILYYVYITGKEVLAIDIVMNNWPFIFGGMTPISVAFRYVHIELSRVKDAKYFGISSRMILLRFNDLLLPSLFVLIPLLLTVILPLAVMFMFLLDDPLSPLYGNLAARFILVFIPSGISLVAGNLAIGKQFIANSKKGLLVIILILMVSLFLATNYAVFATSAYPNRVRFSSLMITGSIMVYFGSCALTWIKSLSAGYFAKGKISPLTIVTYEQKPYLLTHRHSKENWLLFPCELDESNKNIKVTKGKYVVKSLKGSVISELANFSVEVT